ncbi:MAG: ATP-binding cassette domain-containing protein [Terriglobales bacterium]
MLENFDVAITAGEFVAIVGRSGCGKSTLLRSVAGLETPQAGTITLGAVPASRASDVKPDVRVMFGFSPAARETNSSQRHARP